MSLENVIGGKLKLKGKPLNERDALGIKKKKKKKKSKSESLEMALKEMGEEAWDDGENEQGTNQQPAQEDHRTEAEKRYDEQLAKIEARRVGRSAEKSHREKVEDFNKYLANLSEHYDIPKVGPG
eukprot:TRINITY_DN22358_c0_g1_i1.p1 TRINITY_DN22358_c0_g1~~TRINITY_DN22358_c0_g1_i1.p1  ORF type:complete len:125 (-),score=40.50 TRINITY_DN22358_c0_g1_i1:57-431(-)